MWVSRAVVKQQVGGAKFECGFCKSLSDTLITIEHSSSRVSVQRCFDCAKYITNSTAEDSDQLIEENAARLERYEDALLVEYMRHGVLGIHLEKQIPCLPGHTRAEFINIPASTLIRAVEVVHPEVGNALRRFVQDMC